ncbi:Maf family nucleotide pyrophosphatase [Desulfothermus naphthae]
MHSIKGPFKNLKNIILASASPRRQALLAKLGIYFEVMVSDGKEKTDGDKAEILVLENARAKAESVLRKKVKGVIVAADTLVTINGVYLGKPKDKEDAILTLKKLMGNWHQVYTGCYIIDSTNKHINVQKFYVKSHVLMDKVDDNILEKYVDTGEPMDKAGGYAIQGIGSFLIKEIKGSYSNVIGLPLNELVKHLLKISAIGV